MFERQDLPSYGAACLALGLTLTQSAVAQPADFNAETATAPPAVARSAPETKENSADRLFRSGRDALQRGDYQEACAMLAESDRIEPSPGAKLNRALCEEPLGHLALAFRLLDTAIANLPPNDERALIAQRHADDLRSKLGFLTLTLPPESPGTARVIIDGRELTSAELGVPLAFDLGAHVIEVNAQGYSGQVSQVRLSAGESLRLSLSLGAPRSTASSSVRYEAPPPRTSSWRTVGFGLEGAAAALAVTSIVTGILAYDAKGDMRRACDAHNACSDEGLHAAAQGDSYATISTASFVGALVTGGLGAVLLLTHKPTPERTAISAHGMRWEF